MKMSIQVPLFHFYIAFSFFKSEIAWLYYFINKAITRTRNFVNRKKILLSKMAKPHFYLVVLTSGNDKYSFDIKLALTIKELIISP